MPKMRRRVVCGLSETIATLPPQIAFTSVDLPTFGRPATATIPDFTAARSCFRQFPRVRKELVRRVFRDRPVRSAEVDTVEAPLVQPLATAAAGRGGDRDRLDLARPQALAGSFGDRGPFRTDPERVGGVLDVRGGEDAAVARKHRS